MQDLAAVWRQTSIPVIYRPANSGALLLKLPYRDDNRDWLRADGQRKPQWHAEPNQKYWEIPRSWFDRVIARSLRRFSRIYVIQPYRAMEKCAPACWNAKGFVCECSCMGKNHGSEIPGGQWHVVSETLAVQWHGREFACRLVESRLSG